MHSRTPTTEEESILARLDNALEQRDLVSVGTAYAENLRRHLAALRVRSRKYIDDESPLDSWLETTVWEGVHPSTGEPLDGKTWFDLVVAAADATTDNTEAWCIGDGAAALLAHAHRDASGWLLEARSTHPGVDRMFRALEAEASGGSV